MQSDLKVKLPLLPLTLSQVSFMITDLRKFAHELWWSTEERKKTQSRFQVNFMTKKGKIAEGKMSRRQYDAMTGAF